MDNQDHDHENQQYYTNFEDEGICLPEDYIFKPSNPYVNTEEKSHLIKLAVNFLNNGNIGNGILALEAHLQKNPNDAVAWRVLGKLHMDNDQDGKGTRCLLNSIKIDPNNLDTLLNLGISCTNMLEELECRNHLKHWLMYHPKYQHIVTDPEIIPEDLKGKSFTQEETQKMSLKIVECFEKAKIANSEDLDLITCLGVLHFSMRNYKAAVNSFNDVVKHDPENYSLWNKLGASFVNFQQPEEGIEAHNKALELKPNYVRAWVNFGLAHSNKREQDEAIKFFLTGLELNPEAIHVWSYMSLAALMMPQKPDVKEKVMKRDIKWLKQEFDSISPNELPPPKINYKILNEKYLFKEKTEEWMLNNIVRDKIV